MNVKGTDFRNVLYSFRMHPVTLMWMGYEDSLALYFNCCLDEWVTRKTKSGAFCKNNMHRIMDHRPHPGHKDEFDDPAFISNPDFSMSHRVAMIRKEIARDEEEWYVNFLKDPEFKVPSKFFKLGYYWPTTNSFADPQPDHYKIKEDEKKIKLFKKYKKLVSLPLVHNLPLVHKFDE
jgi:hypothetical protein